MSDVKYIQRKPRHFWKVSWRTDDAGVVFNGNTSFQIDITYDDAVKHALEMIGYIEDQYSAHNYDVFITEIVM